MSAISQTLGVFQGEAAGLILSSTSDTAKTEISEKRKIFPNAIALDAGQIRVKRLRRSVLNATNGIEAQLPKNLRYKKAMLTLTYADNVEWNPKHITDTIKCIRSICGVKGMIFIMCGCWKTQKRVALIIIF